MAARWRTPFASTNLASIDGSQALMAARWLATFASTNLAGIDGSQALMAARWLTTLASTNRFDSLATTPKVMVLPVKVLTKIRLAGHDTESDGFAGESLDTLSTVY